MDTRLPAVSAASGAIQQLFLDVLVNRWVVGRLRVVENPAGIKCGLRKFLGGVGEWVGHGEFQSGSGC